VRVDEESYLLAMRYTGRIRRPLNEARSLLLPVTVACCDDRSVTMKPWAQLEGELREAAKLGPAFNRVFLGDDKALMLSTRRLEETLTAIRFHLPWITKVGSYGDAESLGGKSVEDLQGLHELGLDVIYHCVDSGDQTTMRQTNRHASYDDCVATANRIRDAGIFQTVMVSLGIGGRERSRIHASETARLLTDVDPPSVAALTTTIFANTPLAAAAYEGRFVLPGPFELLEELHTIIDESELSTCLFSALHPSNHLPFEAKLPYEREAMLRILDDFIDLADPSVLPTAGLSAS